MSSELNENGSKTVYKILFWIFFVAAIISTVWMIIDLIAVLFGPILFLPILALPGYLTVWMVFIISIIVTVVLWIFTFVFYRQLKKKGGSLFRQKKSTINTTLNIGSRIAITRITIYKIAFWVFFGLAITFTIWAIFDLFTVIQIAALGVIPYIGPFIAIGAGYYIVEFIIILVFMGIFYFITFWLWRKVNEGNQKPWTFKNKVKKGLVIKKF